MNGADQSNKLTRRDVLKHAPTAVVAGAAITGCSIETGGLSQFGQHGVSRREGRLTTAQRLAADVVVVGGGMAGVCAAIAAARNGASVVLVQDRPVLGGNASSEVLMHVCGADCSGGRKDTDCR